MSIRIALDNPQEFYTNLDEISGHVILGINRVETIGNVVVKLEGDARTALKTPDMDGRVRPYDHSNGVVTESHKLLYRIQQIFPTQDTRYNGPGGSSIFQPGQHSFPFSFKMPLNNICHDPKAMSMLIGVGGMGAPGNPGMLGLGGFRTMDGTRQLMLQHVKSTLPPSLTGFHAQAEIRYYIKVTIQRPGFFKENWRFQVGFKFLPLEPPRPALTSQEAFAKRPFAFSPRTPHPAKRHSFFGIGKGKNKEPVADPGAAEGGKEELPLIEVAARLPHPAIITCNENIPLRIITKKVSSVNEDIYLVGVELVLIGYTQVRVSTLHHTETTKWVVVAQQNLKIPLGKPDDEAGTEFEVPNHLWAGQALPNTVAPSFRACNIERRYELEVHLSLSWGLPGAKGASAFPQMLRLPLKLSNVAVFSGIKPPPELLQAATANGKPVPPKLPPRASQTGLNAQFHAGQQRPGGPPHTSTFPAGPSSHSDMRPPALPVGAGRPAQVHDPLYPPQLGPGNTAPQDDAPPSYDEAMAANASAPSAESRPAYSGVTDANAPSSIPENNGGNEKRGWH
ncbi:arrestin [Microdochium bolleyi]|uniref:Arrestin n=1 Tax=Microdochium bolleyi TaxID=196109 RepID=A0A136J488_9PEZI|nr:arrestin [Microdochium bolleyi]